MDELERHNCTHTKACARFVTQLSALIDIFAGIIKDENITELKRIWLLVRGMLQPETVVEQCGHYFLYFKDKILSDKTEDHDAMINFDYTTLIVKGCANSTKNLIMALTTAVRSAWRKDDAVVNESIRKNIIVLTKLADISARARAMIDALVI
jgi:hypothetical protein